MTLKVPNTGQAITFDVGDGDVHPRNKQDMGYRLALVAEAKVYGQDVEYSGPMYKGMKVEGDKIRLSFNFVGGGLTTKCNFSLVPLPEAPKDTPLIGSELKRFEIAGADRKFVWAMAKIDGDTVVVWSNKSPSPSPSATPGPTTRPARTSTTRPACRPACSARMTGRTRPLRPRRGTWNDVIGPIRDGPWAQVQHAPHGTYGTYCSCVMPLSLNVWKQQRI